MQKKTAQEKRKESRVYFSNLKKVRNKYRDHIKEFVKIIEYYSLTGDSGQLARVALQSWNSELASDDLLNRHFTKGSNK